MDSHSQTVWSPQPGPQQALVECPFPEIFFGGARGGGKTDGVLGKWAIKERRYGSDFNAIMFRRTTVSAEDAVERSKQIYLPLGAKFVGSPNPLGACLTAGAYRSGISKAWMTPKSGRGAMSRTPGWKRPVSTPCRRRSTGCSAF